MITKIEEKLQGLEAGRQEQKNMDQFMEAHGDELPFVEPEVDQNAQSVQNEKIVKIEPPVEKEKLEAKSKSVTISREQKEPEKKASVKEKLAEGKAKIAKKDQEKRAPRKELDKASLSTASKDELIIGNTTIAYYNILAIGIAEKIVVS